MRPSTLLFLSAAAIVNAGGADLFAAPVGSSSSTSTSTTTKSTSSSSTSTSSSSSKSGSTTSDVTVTTTTTLTHTTCPYTTPSNCLASGSATGPSASSMLNAWLNPDMPAGSAAHYWADWTNTAAGAATTTVTSDPSGTTTGSGSGSGWISAGGNGTGSGMATGTGSGSGWISAGGNMTTVTSKATVTATVSIGNGTTTTSLPSTTSAVTNSTIAINSTTPVNGNSDTGCNTASDRSVWCDSKNTATNYYEDQYTTGKQCVYNFDITNTTLSFDAGPVLALAINGQTPGPLIECNWGDEVVITVTNSMTDNATTIHWHGIRQEGTNDQDGVPGVTECGLAPGQTRTYTWIASSYGTTWYHSHMLTQYGDGVRGPIIIHGPATANYDVDMGAVMLTETFGDVTSGDVTAAQANWRAGHLGPQGTFNYLLNGKNKSPDLTTGEHPVWSVTAGKKHLFRFINGATQNIFSVHFDNHEMTVIAADLVPIVPYTTSWLNIGIGQRYDVIVDMDQSVAGYYLRAVTQTACPSSCVNDGLGDANGIILYNGANSTAAPTSSYGNVTAADFATCVDEPLASLVPFVAIDPDQSTFTADSSTIPAGAAAPVTSTDDGLTFRWYINNAWMALNFTQPSLKTIASGANFSSLDNSIHLSGSDTWVYFVIANQFFASHPMHLHGHDMSILYQSSSPFVAGESTSYQWTNPARRDTIMLDGGSPGSTGGHTVIGFKTDNPGAWVMHCHIIFHVDGGLALQFIEREDDIPSSYAEQDSFEDECSAMAAFETSYPQFQKTSVESGLRRRLVGGAAEEKVVRRSDSTKKYLDSFKRRHAHGSS